MIKRLSWYQKVLLFFYHFLLFTVPLFFSFRTEELFEFNKMILVYVFTILIGGVWLLRMVAEKRLVFRRTALDIPLLLFLVSQILATIFSMHPRTSMLGYYSRFHGGLYSIISYYVLYYAFVSNIPFKAVLQLLYTTFISATIVALYGILEHFGHSPSCFLLTNGQSFGVDCWIQKVQERVFASFGQPNWLAAYAITLLPVGIFLTIQKKAAFIWRFAVGISTVLLFMVLLFTGSRSGFLGLTAAMLIMIAGILYLNWKKSATIQQPAVKILSLFVVLFIALAALFGTPFSPPLSELLNSSEVTTQEQTEDQPAINRLEVGGTESGEIRKIVWQGAIDVWQRYPVFGSGVETFAYSYYQDRPAEHNLVSEWDFLYNKAHNEFLNFLATTGIIGLGTYVLLLGWFSFIALTLITKKKSPFALSLFAGIVALSISNFFGFSTVMVTVLMFLYFAWISLEKEVRETQSESINTKEQPSTFSAGWQFGASSLIVLMMLMLLASIYNYRQADVAYSQGKNYLSAGETQAGLLALQESIERSPNEAVFYDKLSEVYGSLAVASAQQNQATQAAELASTAMGLSNRTLELNPVHLNFYKTRARMFITLAQIDLAFLEQARDTLLAAIERSPTDAKLWYNLGLVEWGLENRDESIAALEKTIELKPNYEVARLQLAKEYEATNSTESARLQYEYVINNLSPNNPTALEALENL